MRTKPFGAGDAKWIIITIFVVFIILLIVFRTQIQKLITGKGPTAPGGTKAPAAVPPTQQSSNTTGASNAGLNMNLTLQQGSTGPEVKQLQTWLGVTPDGIFGSGTESALFDAIGDTVTTLGTFYSDANEWSVTVNTGAAAPTTSTADSIAMWFLTL